VLRRRATSPKPVWPARQRLEQTNETLDRIAEQTGFGSSINLRRLFEKQLHLTPGISPAISLSQNGVK
jgi:transcriptional regulator GlxA family with amidase domain